MQDDRDAAETDLQTLRRRLYAPGATDSDRGRYVEELARVGRPEEASGAPRTGGAEPDPPRSRPARPGAVLVASGLALVLGIVLGAVAAVQTTRAPSPQPTAAHTQPAVTAPLAVPRPVVAVALGTDAERRADRRTLAAAVRLQSDAARQRAVAAVGMRFDLQRNLDWMRRTGCSVWTGQRNFSPAGLRSTLPADTTSSRPFGNHFRIRVYLAGSADWNWVASGRTRDDRTGVLGLGAGSRTAGSSQVAEFDVPVAATITAVDIRTTPETPFVWTIDSCTAG